MARFTVEDCLSQIDNRFDLTLIAAKRARQLDRGSSALVDNKKRNKSPIVALREIAAGKVDQAVLQDD